MMICDARSSGCQVLHGCVSWATCFRHLRVAHSSRLHRTMVAAVGAPAGGGTGGVAADEVLPMFDAPAG